MPVNTAYSSLSALLAHSSLTGSADWERVHRFNHYPFPGWGRSHTGNSGKSPGLFSWAGIKSLFRTAKNILKGSTIGFAKNIIKGLFCDKQGRFNLWKSILSLHIVAGAAALMMIPGGQVIALGLAGLGVGMAVPKILKSGAAIWNNYARGNWQAAEAAGAPLGEGLTELGLSVVGAKSALVRLQRWNAVKAYHIAKTSGNTTGMSAALEASKQARRSTGIVQMAKGLYQEIMRLDNYRDYGRALVETFRKDGILSQGGTDVGKLQAYLKTFGDSASSVPTPSQGYSPQEVWKSLQTIAEGLKNPQTRLGMVSAIRQTAVQPYRFIRSKDGRWQMAPVLPLYSRFGLPEEGFTG